MRIMGSSIRRSAVARRGALPLYASQTPWWPLLKARIEGAPLLACVTSSKSAWQQLRGKAKASYVFPLEPRHVHAAHVFEQFETLW